MKAWWNRRAVEMLPEPITFAEAVLMAISKCGACGRVFGGVAGFDSHRRGGRCTHPADLGMVERDGTWRKPMSQAARERIQDIKNVREEQQ